MGTSNEETKVVTRYDRKMQERKNNGHKKKADWTTWLIIGIVAAFIIIVACVYFVKKDSNTNKPYFTVGEYEVTKLEYDYYFNTVVNNFYNQNGDYIMFMGIDRTKPLDEQPCIYDTNLSWQDYFDQGTVPLIQSVKAVKDEATAKGFEYDVTEDYKNYIASVDAQITAQGVSEDYFYENSFGKYATESSLEPFVKDYLLYSAYYAKLQEDNAATADEVAAEYEANPEQYDTVDYRLFSMVADVAEDATEEEIAAAMDVSEEKANELMDRYKAGEDWRELCYEYAKEDAKENFDPEAEKDATAITGSTKQYVSTNYSDWLFDPSRAAGDVMAYRDDTNKATFVIVFDKAVKYDVTADTANIAGNLTNQKVADYIEGLTEKYPLVDADGHLEYLKKETAAPSETEDSNAAASEGTESTAADSAADGSDAAETDTASSESAAE